MYFKTFILILSFFTLSSISLKVDLSNFSQRDYEVEPFILENLEINSDISIDKSEIIYLTDFYIGDEINSKKISEAIFHLYLKNRFRSISINIENNSLTLNLEVEWKLNKIIISGQFFGKYNILQNYLINIGDIFDIKKHFLSVSKIKNYLNSMGYMDAKVETKIVKIGDKNLDVFIKIKKRRKFLIKEVDFVETYFDTSCSAKASQDTQYDRAALRNVFDDASKELFKQKLIGLKYDQVKIGKVVKRIKNQLLASGINVSNLSFKILKNSKRREIKLLISAEFKKLKSIKFSGNKYFSDEYLLSHIYSNDIFVEDFYPVLIVEHLINLYKKHGFLNVNINFQDQNELVININEKDRAIITEIDINSSVFAKEFLVRKFFRNILNKKFYDKNLITKSMTDLSDFYSANGFLDFKILQEEVVKSDSEIFDSYFDTFFYEKLLSMTGPFVSLCPTKPLAKSGSVHPSYARMNVSRDELCKYRYKLTIEEGTRTYLSSVNIRDFSKYNKKLPYGNLKKCVSFDKNIINIQKKWLTLFFKNIGYKNFEFIPNISKNNNIIDIEWIYQKKESPFKFGKTILNGNVKVPFQNIYKEILWSDLEPLNKEDVDATFLRLKEINGFESVHITPSKFITSDNSNPILVNLINLSKFELHARLGFQQVNNSHILNWKSRSTYKLGGSFILRNPFNIGDSFKADADFTIFYRHLVAQYNLPWVFKIPIRTLMRFYFNRYLQPLYIGSAPIYRINQTGGLIALNYKFRFANLGTSFGGEALRVTQMSDKVARAIDFSSELIDERLPFIFAEPMFFVEYVDSKINPTKGVSSFVSIKGALSPFDHDLSYLRILFENSVFYPIIHNLIFAVRARFGHIFISDISNLLPSERFYLGGSNSVRSYEPDFAPPLGAFQDDGKIQLFPQGSRTMFNANLELRFKIFKSVGAALFQDFGFLTRGNKDLRQEKFVTATGFGFRYFTPIGPLRFDIGWRPKHNEDDSNFAWYLTLGQAF
ncbi:hypothetical protein A3F66_00600 [candidate division TM6 bacterium RIFCSPHIGHO2_12_FULL_32_22]|nr:MAG: hypothetical protein A3F66_00600 [candidate division TM6 bacterium RIFCSPHIGHO2_12_FULL_32_22]